MPSAIVAPQPLAVEEGAKVLMAGGNAVDAAVTCALVQAIVDPHMCGLGGYALLNLHLAGQPRPMGLDAPALAGSRVRPELWQDRLLRPSPDGWGYFLQDKVNDVGYTSICTPGTVKALSTMLDRWGTLAWTHAAQPAIQIAEEGFVVSQSLANRWKQAAKYPEAGEMIDRIRANPEASRIYLKPNGLPYDTGDRLRNPDYANSLRHLAEQGTEDFYTGQMARRMAADLATHGSFVTAQDLATYSLREVEPVVSTYRDYTVASAPPPHGGPTLLAILNILEGYDLVALGHNSPQYIHRVSMAMKAAFADRNPTMADPAFVDVPLDWMTSKDRAAHWRRRIDEGAEIQVDFSPSGSPHTTHVTVVDGKGNCVSLTHSLGSSSGVITPALGFMYNNSMVNFHPLPGHPNSMAPHKGRTTGMAPTIVYRNGRPVLVLGAPGATFIITSIVQVILNVLDFGMGIGEAVHAPRFDCQAGPIRCQARIPEFVCAQVRKRHPIERLTQSHGGLGLVHAITLDPETGALTGAADSGADGMALVH